jgi:hypothetical protein
MGGDLDRWRGGALAALVAPLANVTDALHVGTHIPVLTVAHMARAVPAAAEGRAMYLPDFARADAGYDALCDIRGAPLDRAVAVEIVATLLDSFGAKADKGLLVGMVDMLESDALARASKMWEPIDASPAALALACRKLIATRTFVPRPAELAEAVREAVKRIDKAFKGCARLVEHVRKADAVLLEFAPKQWRVPYLTPTYRPLLARMLELHETWGDESDAFNEGEPNSFSDALERAKAELLPALPAKSDD